MWERYTLCCSRAARLLPRKAAPQICLVVVKQTLPPAFPALGSFSIKENLLKTSLRAAQRWSPSDLPSHVKSARAQSLRSLRAVKSQPACAPSLHSLRSAAPEPPVAVRPRPALTRFKLRAWRGPRKRKPASDMPPLMHILIAKSASPVPTTLPSRRNALKQTLKNGVVTCAKWGRRATRARVMHARPGVPRSAFHKVRCQRVSPRLCPAECRHSRCQRRVGVRKVPGEASAPSALSATCFHRASALPLRSG